MSEPAVTVKSGTETEAGWRRWGFGVEWDDEGVDHGRYRTLDRVVTAPHWAGVAATAPLPVVQVLSLMGRRKRSASR